MSAFVGRVAAVTGAGSGIGRAVATGLARRGARLALSDVDPAGLAETKRLVEALGADVHTAVVDVADRSGVATWAAEVAGHHGVVHQLYNNAGIGSPGLPVVETGYEAFERVLDVNLWGVIHGTKEFVPHIIASGDGHVTTISSLNGIMAQPDLGPYCTSKFAVRGFSEVLQAEMAAAGHRVGVTTVYPGGVKTNIASRSEDDDSTPLTAAEQRRMDVYNEKLFKTTADEAATAILDGVAKGRSRVLIGQARGVDRLVRVVPGSYGRLVAHWAKRTFGTD
ncbi:MAG: SDR family NAD(P)-dependent oxidoreductase [Aeromicrobium sp.]